MIYIHLIIHTENSLVLIIDYPLSCILFAEYVRRPLLRAPRLLHKI